MKRSDYEDNFKKANKAFQSIMDSVRSGNIDVKQIAKDLGSSDLSDLPSISFLEGIYRNDVDKNIDRAFNGNVKYRLLPEKCSHNFLNYYADVILQKAIIYKNYNVSSNNILVLCQRLELENNHNAKVEIGKQLEMCSLDRIHTFETGVLFTMNDNDDIKQLEKDICAKKLKLVQECNYSREAEVLKVQLDMLNGVNATSVPDLSDLDYTMLYFPTLMDIFENNAESEQNSLQKHIVVKRSKCTAGVTCKWVYEGFCSKAVHSEDITTPKSDPTQQLLFTQIGVPVAKDCKTITDEISKSIPGGGEISPEVADRAKADARLSSDAKQRRIILYLVIIVVIALSVVGIILSM